MSPSYAALATLGFLVAGAIRRREVARLGYDHDPRHSWVGLGALVGAVLGSKLLMVLWEPPESLWAGILSWDFTGKTVLGAIAGGYLGVELVKALIGIRWSTGDGFAVALPVGLAIGRIGCELHGCCAGTPWDGPWALPVGGVLRHPTPLYEASLDLALAAWLWSTRTAPRPAGRLLTYALVGLAAIRFALEPLRADAAPGLLGLTAAQAWCVGWAAALVALDRRRRVPSEP
jgi:prolipoprotein diacylglyceryltransferase